MPSSPSAALRTSSPTSSNDTENSPSACARSFEPSAIASLRRSPFR